MRRMGFVEHVSRFNKARVYRGVWKELALLIPIAHYDQNYNNKEALCLFACRAESPFSNDSFRPASIEPTFKNHFLYRTLTDSIGVHDVHRRDGRGQGIRMKSLRHHQRFLPR